MKIQQVQSANFKANKVSTTMRLSSKGVEEMIEVFKLHPIEDKVFIKKCNETLSQRPSGTLNEFQKQLKEFCSMFLDNSEMPREYFLSIKDEELISGGMVTRTDTKLTLLKKAVSLTNIFTGFSEILNKNALLYALLNDTKKSHPNYRVDVTRLHNNLKHVFIYYETPPYKMSYIQNCIKKNQPLTKFEAGDYKDNTMEEILGTRDFESEVLL